MILCLQKYSNVLLLKCFYFLNFLPLFGISITFFFCLFYLWPQYLVHFLPKCCLCVFVFLLLFFCFCHFYISTAVQTLQFYLGFVYLLVGFVPFLMFLVIFHSWTTSSFEFTSMFSAIFCWQFGLIITYLQNYNTSAELYYFC